MDAFGQIDAFGLNHSFDVMAGVMPPIPPRRFSVHPAVPTNSVGRTGLRGRWGGGGGGGQYTALHVCFFVFFLPCRTEENDGSV